MMDPMVTTYINSDNVAHVMYEYLRQTEGIEVDDVEHLAELLVRDINRIDGNRYESPLAFMLPLAISSTTGSRSSIAHYINRVIAAGHPLTLGLHSLATKILFDDCEEKPRAIGVEYMVGEGLYSVDGRYNASQKGELRTVKAKKEVIVAGGSFNTPQILKLSGIGPREELEALDIPVLVDLPAVVSISMHSAINPSANIIMQGNFMQDNYESPIHIRADAPWIPTANSSCTMTFNQSDPCFVQWETTGTGPYSLSGGTLFSTLRSSTSWDNDTDILILSIAGAGDAGFYPGFSQRVPRPYSWGTSLVKMQTRNPSGTVRLRSKDPREAPEINFNFFAENADADLQALADGVEIMLRVFREAGTNFTVISPNPEVELKQALMDEAFSHHPTSSCRMGPAGSREHCVDSKFRVNGVDGLRVVDASVFPRVPGAMPNGPTFTISRKAFETILEDV
jgi:choline dehydrogenase